MDINSVIKFYRDAYKHEYRTEKILNFYSSNVSHVYYPSTFKLLSEADYELPVDSDWGNDAYSELKLSSSERKMILGVFFIKGNISLLGKSRKMFAPLFLIDAHLSLVNEVYILKINPDSIGVNPVIFDYLNSQSEEAVQNEEFFLNYSSSDNKQFSFESLYELSKKLKEKYKFLNSSILDKRMESNDRLCNMESIYQSRSKKFENVLLPDIALGIVDKPIKSKGVINELNILAEKRINDSSIVSKLFENDFIKESAKKQVDIHTSNSIVPVSLSADQENIIKSASSSLLTLTIGPPGTGKSFSIAALAIQAAYEGKKVLIASKNEQACQVIYNKINNDIGVKGIALNASKARYKISVATKLKNIGLGVGVKQVDVHTYEKIKNDVLRLQSEVEMLSQEISEREKEELKWGKKLSGDNRGLIANIQKQWIKYRYNKRILIWEEKYLLHSQTLELKRKEKELIKITYQNRLYNLLKTSRSEVIQLEKAYQQQHGNLAKKIFSSVDYEVVLKALPIWICKSTDLSDILPLKEDLFDIVIIDEASQCDIASSIPLIYRAKRAVIVGDPNQLRHVSFISGNKENSIRSKYKITNQEVKYRDKSILDLVNLKLSNQNNIIFLSEHYRSMPDIIDFSNKEFYSGELKVMTSNPRTDNTRNLIMNYVKGERDEQGRNIIESEAIIQKLKNLVQREMDVPDKNCTTIGIISPFRVQVNLLKKMIKAKINSKYIKKHNILIGTPYTFQGEERDLIYLSFSIDDLSHSAVLRYLNKPDVFNVSITRAKLRQEVFFSIDSKILKEDSLLYKYINNEYFANDNSVQQEFFDDFMIDVVNFLNENNFDLVFQSKIISGSLLDILLVIENKVLAIDLVGYPGMFEDQLSIESIKRLEKVDIDVFILPFSSWYFDPKFTKKEILKFIRNEV